MKELTNSPILFHHIDWSTLPKVEYKGTAGVAIWQTIQFPGLRVRMVEYSPDYVADHWCQKGHVVLCVAGEFVSEFEDGASVALNEGMSYVVSDDMSSHRSITTSGATLFIIDGDFLKQNP